MIPLLLLALACSPGADDHGHDHATTEEHGHAAADEASFARTRFDGDHELFVELTAPRAGGTTTYHAHVTHLDGYRPATRGTFELRWLQGDEVVHRTADDRVKRPGIYSRTVPVPEAPGAYRLQAAWDRGDAQATWDLGQVVLGQAPAQPQAAPEGEVTFLKEAQWQVDFGIATPVREAVATPLRLPATVHVDSREALALGAPAGGIVLWGAGDTLPVVGQRVEAGQHLGTVVPGVGAGHHARLRAEAQGARIDLELVQQELERVQGLVEQGLLPERRLAEARAAVAEARARRSAARRQLSGDAGAGVPITAPDDGVITRLGVGHGAQATAGEPVLMLATGSSLMLQATLLGHDVEHLAPLAWATVQRGDQQAPHTLDSLGGRVLTEELIYDPRTLAAPVSAWLPGGSGYRPGDLVELTLGVGEGTPHLTVPREAVVEINTRPYVFVMVSGESFTRRAVTLGPAGPERIAILDGLSADDRVVVHGGFDVHVASLGGALQSHRH